MPRIGSFRARVFLALLGVALLPGVLLVATGTTVLSRMGATTGTLGPWESVAESGRELVEAVEAHSPDDPELLELTRRHSAALSESVRQSRLWTAVVRRVVGLLPGIAVVALLLVAALSAWVARRVSRSLAAPVAELVDWTQRIGRGEALPAAGPASTSSREFQVLRHALRDAAHAIGQARDREVESARLRAWTDMARQVAHEIKNRLTPMRMTASTLLGSDDPGVRESAGILIEEVERLDDMARSFSQFARPPEGPRAPVDLAELLGSVAALYRDAVVPVRLEIRSAVPMISGHHELIEGAVRNLLENALEAVDEGRGTRVELSLDATSAHALIRVRDDGPGADPKVAERIWMPEVTTRRRGTGLGLALVRRAAEIHGGTARLEPESSGGSSFVLELPLRRGPGHDGEPSPGAIPRIEGARGA